VRGRHLSTRYQIGRFLLQSLRPTLMTVGYCPQSLALDYPTQLSSREDAQAEIRLPELIAAKMNAEAATQNKEDMAIPLHHRMTR